MSAKEKLSSSALGLVHSANEALNTGAWNLSSVTFRVPRAVGSLVLLAQIAVAAAQASLTVVEDKLGSIVKQNVDKAKPRRNSSKKAS